MSENESKNLIIEGYNKEKLCIVEGIKDVNIQPSYQRYKDLIERLKEIDKILEKLLKENELMKNKQTSIT